MSNSRNLERFLKPDVKLSSNGFDLEGRDVFSTKVGLLQLAKIIPVVPNDYFEIDPTVFIQTDRFNVANFTRMSQHLDLFYVPMTCLQSRWNEWYQQTVDPSNAIFDMHPITSEQQDDFVPYVHLGSLVWSLIRANCIYHADDINDCMLKLAERFDVAVSTIKIGMNLIHDIETQTPPFMGYQNYAAIFSGSRDGYLYVAQDKLGYPMFLNAIRLLDMAGYGNYLPIINMPIFTGNYDQFVNDVLNFDDGTDPASYIDSTIGTVCHLLDTLDKHVNLYSLAAYQAVCHNYFTNPHFERPSVIAYNFDDMDSGDFFNQRWTIQNNNWDHVDYLRDLFTMNYTPWKKDIFLSALPSPQFGDVSVVTVLTDRFERFSGSITSNQSLAVNTTGNPYLSGVGQTSVGQFIGQFSVIDQVKAEALQYWRQQIGRAGYRTADRFRATFGNAPVHSGHIIPKPIGSFYSAINKDQIVGSSGDDFGEKRATGSSLLQNGKIKFASENEFGFIVAIHRILPEADYDSYGIDKHLTKFAPFDFFTAAFQNLGLEAMDVSELSVYNEAFYTGSSIIGYVPRYHEYKTNVDKVHGEFCSMPISLMNQSRSQHPLPYSGYLTSPTVGAFSSFVSSRIDLESYFGSVRQFYVDPAIVDNLFLVSADGEQKTDQFWITSYLDVKSYRSMSVLGLPQF